MGPILTNLVGCALPTPFRISDRHWASRGASCPLSFPSWSPVRKKRSGAGRPLRRLSSDSTRAQPWDSLISRPRYLGSTAPLSHALTATCLGTSSRFFNNLALEVRLNAVPSTLQLLSAASGVEGPYVEWRKSVPGLLMWSSSEATRMISHSSTSRIQSDLAQTSCRLLTPRSTPRFLHGRATSRRDNGLRIGGAR
jgi:hypothetical protein